MKDIPDAAGAEIIMRAESHGGIRAGIVRLEDVLTGPSHKVGRTGVWSLGSSKIEVEKWIDGGRSVLVLGLHHPAGNPQLDWFDRGNTRGNRALTEIIDSLINWIQNAYGINAQLLPYFFEQGGIFLKDAAALAGLGIIGKHNLLINREWGPRIRFRAMLIEGDIRPTEPVENFSPCEACDMVCRKICPGKTFSKGTYDWSACLSQLNINRDNSVFTGERDNDGNPIRVVKWCRECELACPVGDEP
jgi:epoxyqueuosine reductase